MISIILTSQKKKETIAKLCESVVSAKLSEPCEIWIPMNYTNEFPSVKYEKKIAIRYAPDKERGKNRVLNELLRKLKGVIWIFIDGDVFVPPESLQALIQTFSDPLVGCVSGRPFSTGSRRTKQGFWSELLLEAGAHRIRKKLEKQNKFMECSGSLFAVRNMITYNIPENVADDSIIPYLTKKKGYRVLYAEKARVALDPPETIMAFITQKVRAAKGHEALKEYAPFFPKIKSLKNEILLGSIAALSYGTNLKEWIWTLQLFFIRLYIWMRAKWEVHIIKKPYTG